MKLKVSVRDNEPDLHNVHDSPKIERLPFSSKRNQTQPTKRKSKSLTETPEEKEKRLIMQTLDFVLGLHNCLKFSQLLSCLSQALQTQKMFSTA